MRDLIGERCGGEGFAMLDALLDNIEEEGAACRRPGPFTDIA
ncbi:hypothetical protein [Aliiruegeria haliotis]|nr:hypothetical protein [Aliiruegeria haliotis]